MNDIQGKVSFTLFSLLVRTENVNQQGFRASLQRIQSIQRNQRLTCFLLPDCDSFHGSL